ncbi:MAG: flagellar biosynthesis anti-sigma factor FlgM [Bacillota bacterium]
MKVEGKGPGNPIQAYQAQKRINNQADKTRTPGTDSVEISREGRELRELSQQVMALPDTREERVQELQEKIRQGTYHIPGEKIAAKILEEIRLARGEIKE